MLLTGHEAAGEERGDGSLIDGVSTQCRRWRLGGGGATHDLLRRPGGAEEQVDMERVCQQLPSAEPHQRGAGRPVLTAFRPVSFSAVNVVVVDPSGNKASNGWSQRVTQGEREA